MLAECLRGRWAPESGHGSFVFFPDQGASAMRRWIPILVIAALVATTSSPASAFDGKRKGFILGGGLGLGYVNFTQSINGMEGESEGKTALVTNFKIGGGFSEQFWLYYSNQNAWFSLTNVLDNDVTIASGVGGIGFTWFTSPEPKGLFLTGTIGLGSWDAPFEDGSSMWTGFGLMAGVGYEFAAHWAVDLSLMWGTPETTESSFTFKSEFFGVMATVTGMAY